MQKMTYLFIGTLCGLASRARLLVSACLGWKGRHAMNADTAHEAPPPSAQPPETAGVSAPDDQPAPYANQAGVSILAGLAGLLVAGPLGGVLGAAIGAGGAALYRHRKPGIEKPKAIALEM
jgi:hypothetical protein